jgi:hypothetical protein
MRTDKAQFETVDTDRRGESREKPDINSELRVKNEKI